jgi:serine/threonine protein kinase
VLVDFNIASPAGGERSTNSGTPAYQAPDVAERWEPSDDLYAVGVILYELIAGRHPYEREFPVASVPPADPLALRPTLRPALAAIMAKACHHVRAQRYHSAAEMRDDLDAELAALRAAARGIDTESRVMGRTVRDRRRDLGVSIEQLATNAGVPADEIRRFEAGEIDLPSGQAFRLLSELELKLSDVDHLRGPDDADDAT